MKLKATFLRSKVAHRILMLFILCALIPIAVLTIISFSHVTKQLNEQSQKQLSQASKTQGMSILGRLRSLEAEMKIIASNRRTGSGATTPTMAEGFAQDLRERFKGLALVTEAGRHEPLFGRIPSPPKLTAAEKQYLGSGKTVVSNQSGPDLLSRIFMSRTLDPQHPIRGILLGEINPGYLWGVDSLPALIELCVLDKSNRALFCSPETAASFREQAAHKMTRTSLGQFEWKHGNKEYLASYWSIFLKPQFFTSKWTVVLSESRADVLAPIANFKKKFLLVILLSLWVVLLLSLVQIRRCLVPLERLREGTRRIAQREFDSRVTVTSGDEFQELATSFNTMASRLGRQFNALTTINEIDRVILSSLDTEKIVDTVLTQMRNLISCDCVSISLLDSNGTHTAQTYIDAANPESEKQVETITLTPEEVQDLHNNPETLVVNGNLPHYLAPLAERGMKSALVLPIFLQGSLAGIISVGHAVPSAHSQEDVLQARQVADQVAVALSNARLIEELDQLSWGTLTALARAIDTKSHWTAGHSERVTKMALKIGSVLRLSPKEMEILHRGGLLHDIGKIGTPATILDSSGKLTEEELRLMREHVRMGARILKPIPGFAELIPIVLQHHEWFDGSGYPDGLAGEAISSGARIFAVADCCDALISDRPYRVGLARERVTEMIKQESGTHFDPEVVEAFLKVMAQKKDREEEAEAVYAPPLDVS